MSGFALKVIAILAMLIDHLGATVFDAPEFFMMRFIGRITFPVMCFLIVEGFHHTRDRKKYLINLSAFALISEVPFDLAFNGKLFDPLSQNVFFTLALGLGVLYSYDKLKNNSPMQLGCTVALFALGDLLSTDYGSMGIALIFALYILRDVPFGTEIAIGGAALIYLMEITIGDATNVYLNLGSNPVQAMMIITLPLIKLYNGKRGGEFLPKSVSKYAFYLFYPVHLLVIYAVSGVLG